MKLGTALTATAVFVTSVFYGVSRLVWLLGGGVWCSVICGVVLTVAPVAVLFLTHGRSLLGFTALACLFQVPAVVFVCDLLSRFAGVSSSGSPWAAAVVLAICCYGLVNGLFVVRTSEITLKTSKVSSPVRIVHVSDIHVASRNKRWVERVAKLICGLSPDIVAVTGDVVDEPSVAAAVLQPLESIACPVFFVTGNHEAKRSMKDYPLESTLKSVMPSIVILEDRTVHCNGLRIVGVGDCENGLELCNRLNAVPDLISESSEYTVLLHHRPHGLDHVASHAAGVDLFLSGHTHAGQYFPMVLLSLATYGLTSGLFHRGRTSIHVSPGAGTGGQLFRTMGQNSVTLINIVPEK